MLLLLLLFVVLVMVTVVLIRGGGSTCNGEERYFGLYEWVKGDKEGISLFIVSGRRWSNE